MSPLVVLVAIDIFGGRVVRFSQGRPEDMTVYGEDPVQTAVRWEGEGAEWLHVVDLDGALRGTPKNSEWISKILQSVKLPVQVSGGVRSMESVERWIELGASRVVVGTKAVEEEFLEEVLSKHADSIVAAVDSRGGLVRLAGWKVGTEQSAVALAERLASLGVRRLMCTDIDRDGTLRGPNFGLLKELLESVDVPVIASGGVSAAEDVARLAGLGEGNLEGVIIGKALYSGALTLDEAVRAARG